MPTRSVRAFRESAKADNTLAMANLGNKLLNGGFFEEANELCKTALAVPEYHKSVPSLLSRLQAVDDEEDQKLNQALEKVKTKAAFYRELGRNAVAETPRTIATKWTAREGTLTATLANDELKFSGNYEVPTNLLYGVGGAFAPPNDKYRIEFSGYLRGRMFAGTVTRKREGGALAMLDGVPSKTLMYLSADGMTLNVMENASSTQLTLYELRVVDSEGARTSSQRG